MNRWISFLFLPCMSYKSARALSLSVLLAKRVNRSHPERDGPCSLSPLSLFFANSPPPSFSLSLSLCQYKILFFFKKLNSSVVNFFFFFSNALPQRRGSR
jgi:hypothetical protein